MCTALNQRLELEIRERRYSEEGEPEGKAQKVKEVDQGTQNDFGIRLNSVDKACGLVPSEVSRFAAIDGFINIHLVNEQYMDRVCEIIKTRKVTNKDKNLTKRASSSLDAEEVDSVFAIKPIGYLESCFREKFGTPR